MAVLSLRIMLTMLASLALLTLLALLALPITWGIQQHMIIWYPTRTTLNIPAGR